jgi:hypothetical protein
MRTVLVAVCSAMVGFGMAASPVPAKTVKECQAEWRTHKDIFEPKGISEHDYIDECRDFPTAAPETPALAKPAPTTAAPAPVKPAPVAVAAPVAPGHPSTEAGAAKPKKPEARQLVASPPPAPFSSSESCVSRHSNTIIHSARCGF